MKDHARLSPSDSVRWMACPASIEYEIQLTKAGKIAGNPSSSDAALEGTAAHFLAETCLKNDQNAKLYLGQHLKGVEITEEMVGNVNMYLEYVRSLEGRERLVEKSISLSAYKAPHLRGTVDCVVGDPDYFGVLHVIDYKNGRGIVNPENNTQLLYYAAGLIAEYWPEEIILTIIQPKDIHSPIKTWSINVNDLENWALTILLPAAQKTLEESPPFVAGENQCRWCRCAPYCEDHLRSAYWDARNEFEENEIDAELAVQQMPIDRVLKLLNARNFIENALKAAQYRVQAELERGNDVPGYKLVTGVTRRRWAKNAEEVLLSKKIPKKVLYTQKLNSFTQLEKIDGGKYKKIVEELVEKPEGRVVLAKTEDPRPALALSAGKEFENV